VILASIPSPESSASWIWPAVASIGGIIVFVGLLIEKAADWMNEKFMPNEEYKPHKTLEDVGWTILMVGILAEIAVGFALAAKDEIVERQTANQIAQTSTNVAKIDPLNQPIGLLTASVSLFEIGTNRSNLDFSTPLGGKFLVRLKLRNSEHSDSAWPFELVCTSGDTRLGTTILPVSADISFNMLVWDLEFGSSLEARTADRIPTKATVRDADDLDSIEFDAPFLRPETEISGGIITLTINSTKKVFEIPPQRVKKVEEIPLTKEQQEQGYIVVFISPQINKTVTLVSWASKKQ
jgi:hypothetical protein